MAKKTPATTQSIIPFKTTNILLGKLDSFKKFRSSKMFYIVLIALGLLLLVLYKKNWIVAATVNGSPVSNLELQMRLNEQFRTQTLNSLINEKIILGEATKNNVAVTASDIDKKISGIEANVGGAQALDGLLSQQGQTRSSIRQQIKLQTTIEKLYANEATISAEEVAQFIEQNKAQLQATDSAGQEKEAEDAIKNQKLSQIFSQKFQDLRQKAKIQIF
ncbi:MAG: SurA N-terminal domain-containing protein [Candidatus Daviesbacteria bacterium]|nr:SurA N-terminal domain-containing protein [Candidatus Daviesbacteria bacterium]